MRIISQDGTTDVPYEHVAVIRLNKKIYFFNSNLITDSQALAKYSTEEKAEKAMKMLRDHYEGVNFLKTIINTEKGTSFVGGLSKTDFDKLTQNYFRLPKDDEVEV